MMDGLGMQRSEGKTNRFEEPLLLDHCFAVDDEAA